LSGRWAPSSPTIPPAIRRVRYATNALESLNAQVRKILKTRGHLPNDEAATKLTWLALRNVTAKWKVAALDWKNAMIQFAILYEERFAAQEAQHGRAWTLPRPWTAHTAAHRRLENRGRCPTAPTRLTRRIPYSPRFLCEVADSSAKSPIPLRSRRLLIEAPDCHAKPPITHRSPRLLIEAPDCPAKPPITQRSPRLLIEAPDYSAKPPIALRSPRLRSEARDSM
jgi:putative transposase